MSETELPGKLNKLNIASADPELKKMAKNENPFWGESDGTLKLSTSLPSSIVCKQRQRRNSESVLDEFRASQKQIEPTRLLGIQKRSVPNLKKSTTLANTNRRKLTLREPILRALQSCTMRSLSIQADNSAMVNDKTFGKLPRSTLKKENLPGINDFRDLINECQELLENNVDFSTRLNEEHKSKNFTTLRDSIKANLIESSATASLNKLEVPFSANSILGPTWQSSLIAGEQNSIANTVTTIRANNSSTCSQQAGNGVVNNDVTNDVTINDLAGYFENIVHIPKKMSSMAEMMYT